MIATILPGLLLGAPQNFVCSDRSIGLGMRGFLFVGDPEVARESNMAHIHDHKGFFNSPLPMDAFSGKILTNALYQYDQDTRLAG